MVGLIQRKLLELVESLGGPAAVAEVRRRTGIPEERFFRVDEAYDDREWQLLLANSCEVLGIRRSEAEEAYADFVCRGFLQRFPTWFRISRNARQFLERQPAIHNSFATSVRDPAARQAIHDKFRLDKTDDELVVHYRSPNRLCGLYQAAARWLIDHYGDDATVTESNCMKRGDNECEIHVRWNQ